MGICHDLFIHSSIGGYVGCSHLAFVKRAAINIRVQVLGDTFLFLLGTQLGVALLGDVVTLWLASEDSPASLPFPFPPAGQEAPLSPPPHLVTC